MKVIDRLKKIQPITVSISMILGSLIGGQQMLKTLVQGAIDRSYLLVSLRGAAVMMVAIWIGGIAVWILVRGILGMLTKKSEFIKTALDKKRVGPLLMLGVFISLGVFLFVMERVPFFAIPYPLLILGVTVALIVFLSAILGLMIYSSLVLYEKWLKKVNWELIINIGGGLSLLVWLVLLLPVVVKRAGLRMRQTEKKNVVLITSDTLRGDRFSQEYMPQTYQWFKENGVIFKRGYSVSPWTLPSFASMMTGKQPMQLAVDRFQHLVTKDFLLLPQLETMAERFQDEGYSTMAVVTNGLLVEQRGFDQGFDSFENVETVQSYHWGPAVKQTGWYITLEKLGMHQTMRNVYEYFVGITEEREDFKVEAEMVSDQAIYRLQEMKEPFFAWIHYVDAHSMFEPPEGFGPDISHLSAEDKEGVKSGSLAKEDEHLRETVIELYDGEVRYHDGEIARVLNFLNKRGLSKRTAVVFTADHGEQFWEDDRQGHGFTLRNEEVRVPLAVSPSFDFDSRTTEEVVSLYKLEDWLLQMGTGDPGKWLEKERERPTMTGAMRTGSEKKGLVDDKYKYIWEVKSGLFEVSDSKTDEPIPSYQLPRSSEDKKRRIIEWWEENEKERLDYLKSLKRLDVNLEGVAGY